MIDRKVKVRYYIKLAAHDVSSPSDKLVAFCHCDCDTGRLLDAAFSAPRLWSYRSFSRSVIFRHSCLAGICNRQSFWPAPFC
jgi:hypothetical protein